MSPPEPTDLAERALNRRKREDAALAVPALGVLLLVSPVMNIFTRDGTILGLPAAFVWVFAVWAFLILLTWRLTRRLQNADDKGHADGTSDPMDRPTSER
ncbi:MAG: hypothetical protein HUJ24_10660 [Rhodobacteraceae bacterium]|nr:hypothetical protein [Paracoccaceae bacterium]